MKASKDPATIREAAIPGAATNTKSICKARCGVSSANALVSDKVARRPPSRPQGQRLDSRGNPREIEDSISWKLSSRQLAALDTVKDYCACTEIPLYMYCLPQNSEWIFKAIKIVFRNLSTDLGCFSCDTETIYPIALSFSFTLEQIREPAAFMNALSKKLTALVTAPEVFEATRTAVSLMWDCVSNTEQPLALLRMIAEQCALDISDESAA